MSPTLRLHSEARGVTFKAEEFRREHALEEENENDGDAD
jgi:hypothetical protein